MKRVHPVCAFASHTMNVFYGPSVHTNGLAQLFIGEVKVITDVSQYHFQVQIPTKNAKKKQIQSKSILIWVIFQIAPIDISHVPNAREFYQCGAIIQSQLRIIANH